MSPAPEPSSARTLLFVVLLCAFCGGLLASVSFGLGKTQKEAQQFDRSKQMLIAVKVLTHAGYFELSLPDGSFRPASFDPETKTLLPLSEGTPPKALKEEIQAVAATRIRPLLSDAHGNVFSLEEKGVDLDAYLEENKKRGYASLPLKLFYLLLPNAPESAYIDSTTAARHFFAAEAFIFPVSGSGLWAPIYGYLALSPDGNTILGTTWYEHGETPGLGANISEGWWQKQFYKKRLFQSGAEEFDFSTADIGIHVVKGKVMDLYGLSSKGRSAVDGISGATLSGDGVTAAYRDSLAEYRPLLVNIHHSHAR